MDRDGSQSNKKYLVKMIAFDSRGDLKGVNNIIGFYVSKTIETCGVVSEI